MTYSRLFLLFAFLPFFASATTSAQPPRGKNSDDSRPASTQRGGNKPPAAQAAKPPAPRGDNKPPAQRDTRPPAPRGDNKPPAAVQPQRDTRPLAPRSDNKPPAPRDTRPPAPRGDNKPPAAVQPQRDTRPLAPRSDNKPPAQRDTRPPMPPSYGPQPPARGPMPPRHNNAGAVIGGVIIGTALANAYYHNRYPVVIEQQPNVIVVPNGTYSPTLGAEFKIVRVRVSGKYVSAARLTENPVEGSPLEALNLKNGDVILQLDNSRTDSLAELDRHIRSTSVLYIKAGTPQVRLGTIYIPTDEEAVILLEDDEYHAP